MSFKLGELARSFSLALKDLLLLLYSPLENAKALG
jgi:hypothetical protein